MTFNKDYLEKTRLLIDVAGQMDWDSCFAIKGGTAINLFYSNLPRLSVDIDLVYLKRTDRKIAFTEMISYLENLDTKLNRLGFESKIISVSKNNPIGKLFISRDFYSIILEPNIITRGTLLNTKKQMICKKATELFHQEIEVRCLDIREVYAGKMNAFLDRQHPRDIFDMLKYNNKQGISDIMDLIMIYILQNNRPFHELLNPNMLDIHDAYQTSFEGMTDESITEELLLSEREIIMDSFKKHITIDHVDFFISCLELTPNWEVFKEYSIQNLPAVQWRMQNIEKMPSKKRREEIDKLNQIKKNVK